MEPIIVEKLLNAPAQTVWSALTEKDEMKEWYFDLDAFNAQNGFTFRFTGGPSPEKQYLHICEVTEVIPNKKLVYTWRYEGYAGISTVIFELFEKGTKTLLRLTHEGLDTFPSTNPDFASANFQQGWNDIITNSLSNYLEKSST